MIPINSRAALEINRNFYKFSVLNKLEQFFAYNGIHNHLHLKVEEPLLVVVTEYSNSLELIMTAFEAVTCSAKLNSSDDEISQ